MTVNIGIVIGIILGAASAQVTPAPSQTLWGQCGGIAWTGPTTCSPYYSNTPVKCTTYNPYYAQCIPDNDKPTTTPSPTTTIRDCMPMLSCTTSLCGANCPDRTLTACVTHNACATTTPGRPTFPICECTTSSTSSRCTTTSTCSPYLDCCKYTQTACASYCIGQPPPTTVPYPISSCSRTTCAPTSTTCISSLSTCAYFSACCGMSQIKCANYCEGATPPPIQSPTTIACVCPTPTTTPIDTCSLTSRTCTTYDGCCGRTSTACVNFCGTSFSGRIPYTRATCTVCPTSSTTTCIRTSSCYDVPLCCGRSTSSCISWCSGTTPPPTSTATRLVCTCPPNTTTTIRVTTPTAIVKRVHTVQHKRAWKGKAYGDVKA
ncbi:hypothetical protein TWF788_010948 [Orbilia oligospora]|uniref:CBM1 domain-containing protein n=1 Tax=Orbilia oligospora TaxID=2813651 RepID=A0A7C8KMI1_ORBOL|nr:hypothetical protein TWF788_010948 [Orbilia oligospora]